MLDSGTYYFWGMDFVWLGQACVRAGLGSTLPVEKGGFLAIAIASSPDVRWGVMGGERGRKKV